ncbi:hypothetical protein BSKO_04292 [Bryopsis sp. KO-2023]|nr:hypothetical protein BSKO_04292 [Bryopsis sp. KO-2023]
MGYRAGAGQPGALLLDRVPGWFSAAVLLGGCSFLMGSLGGRVELSALAVAGIATGYVLLAVNILLVCFGAYSAWHKSLGLWESWQEAGRFIERIWQIVTQGSGSAGLVGKDLGEPDENGVYSRKTPTGSQIYLRLDTASSDYQTWEWSFDKDIWMPAFRADSFWNGSYGVSSSADKILIRRLEVECVLRAQQPDLPKCTHPPPIHLELSYKDQERLMKNVPKDFLCPMSMEIMTEPVVSPSGVTYNRKTVEEWINEHHTDPATKAPLQHDNLYPNLALRDMIQAWLVEHEFEMT